MKPSSKSATFVAANKGKHGSHVYEKPRNGASAAAPGAVATKSSNSSVFQNRPKKSSRSATFKKRPVAGQVGNAIQNVKNAVQDARPTPAEASPLATNSTEVRSVEMAEDMDGLSESSRGGSSRGGSSRGGSKTLPAGKGAAKAGAADVKQSSGKKLLKMFRGKR